MAFALHVTVALRMRERFGRNIQHAVVKHVENVQTRKAAARMPCAGALDDFEQLAAVLPRFLRKLMVGVVHSSFVSCSLRRIGYVGSAILFNRAIKSSRYCCNC